MQGGDNLIDINYIINELISPIIRLESQFPSINSSFPLATVTTVSDISTEIHEGEERLSDIIVQLDVWDKHTAANQTRQRCESLAIEVNAKMLESGFKRVFAQNFDESGMFRKCMRFSAEIDEYAKKIYRRN